MSARLTVIAVATLGILFAAAPAYAAASQCAQFETIGRGATTDYQPFDQAPTIDSFDLRARMSNGVGGVRFLLVDNTPRGGGFGIGDAGPVDYNVIWTGDTSRRVLVLGQEQPLSMTGALITPKGNSGQGSTTFQFVIPAGQEATARRHQENLTVRFQCLDTGGQPLGPTQEQYLGVNVAVIVPAYAAAYIGSVGQAQGTIDFGELGNSDADVTRSIGITALSTTPYEVKVVTEQNSRLISPGNSNAAIPYTMKYAGQSVESGGRVLCPMTRAPMGTVEPFAVTLDGKAVLRQPAGTYRGTVLVTVTPRDLVAPSGCVISK